MVAALIGIVAIVILSYIAWTSRSRSSDKTAPTAQVAEPREQSAPPSASFPIPQQTNNADPSAAQRAEKKAARPSASARPIPDSPDAGHAAMRGDGSEELDTARQYLGGGATNKNSRTAAQWLWKSVSKQNEEAVLMLSDLYVRGDGVPHSCEQARVLLVAAAKRGSSAAAQKLRAVEMGCR
jgi:TPR repeat protein